ncbi:hypothetical protein C815_00429 [Firmicutes bacterium M10-2]|nr:hypothetical protein C815_00429 [Firmicutes bacterium M10-2]
MEKSKVYFTKDTGSKSLVRLYEALKKELNGNVAVKLHSGERGNQNFLRPEFVKPIIDKVNGTVVECNTAYGHDMGGARFNTTTHMEVMKEHGWTENFDVDILDSEGPDLVLEIPNGKIIKENFVGKDIAKYNSLLVLSHFKGHPMGGYGGALKQLSIGVASSDGKCWIHSTGKSKDMKECWQIPIEHDEFLEAMADAAGSVHNYFKDNVVYINALVNLSVDCDCCHVAEDPCMKDIGIMISTDPVAIDQACLDMVYNSTDPGRDHLVERIESRHGRLTVDAAEKLGYGSKEYELIDID